MLELLPLGDRAFLARFATEDQAAAWSEAVRLQELLGVVDVVTAYFSVGVYADPDLVEPQQLRSILAAITCPQTKVARGREISIPVHYDGPDLADVAVRLGLSVHDLVKTHSDKEYRIFATGFVPGFPYAGYLPAALCGLSRRDSPRTHVPAGSVAIVGRQTGIYPIESPGGWHLIGRTPLAIVDIERGLFPIRAGDRLRFVPIDLDEFTRRRGEPLQ